MTLTPGTRLGPYEVVSLRGKGGMGEVYRARDVRLEREVAIKVLPRELAEDPLLRQRLRREAKTISQLSHPHICTLHDIGAEGGLDFLVMEYLEGETLADRLSRGAMPIDEVIALGGQIAEAVATAHRAGVVHRDLKPGNVMLTRDGAKVLDFGLAKGLEARAAGAGSQSPTVTQPLTSAGSLVGTLLYMAPEQLEGKEADTRSDLWALGAVLYQMVTGAKPFQGGSHASVMAAIMTGQPRAVSELVPSAPARLEWLIARCLEKSPDRRWQSAGDLALELGSLGEVSESPPAGTTGGRRRRAIAVALGVAAAMLVGLGIGRLLPFGASDRAGVAEPGHWTTTVLDSASSEYGDFALTPDGRTHVFAKVEDGKRRWYRRALDSLQTLPLTTLPDLGVGPAFSPDSRQVTIVDARRTLRTMPIEGGEPGSPLAENVDYPGAWSEDGYIYYWGGSSFEESRTLRVRVGGGEPEPIGPGFPTDVLPGGRTVLTTVVGSAADFWGSVTAVDVSTGESRLLAVGAHGRYVNPGFLVFCRNRKLWAAPIVPSSGELMAPARPIEDVAVTDHFIDFCRFAVSRSGNLVYVPSREIDAARLVWVARNGTVERIAPETKAFQAPIASLDGTQISVSAGVRADTLEQWVLDLSTGSWSRPAQTGSTGGTLWLPPDGREILFFSSRVEGRAQVFVQPADRSAPAQPLWQSERPHMYLDVSADGRWVILFALDAPGFLVLDRRTGEVRTVIEDGAVYSAAFHPDGAWIVYARASPGGYDSNLWLAPFPGPGEPRQLTFDGGEEPRWSIGAGEIFYRGPTHLMAIPVEKSGGTLVTGRPRPLFEDRFRRASSRGLLNYSVHPDGRLLMIESADGGGQSAVLVENWRAKLVQAFAQDGRE